MVRLFLRDTPSTEGSFLLGRDIRKRLVKVMRLRTGDSVEVFVHGKKLECRISRILPDRIELLAVRELPAATPPRLTLILAQAIPKGERFDWFIQKSTELGVAEIYPLVTRRTVVHPSNIDAKLQRWNEIADHAAGQSENSYPVLVYPPEPLGSFLRKEHTGLKLFLHEREESQSLKSILQKENANRITVVVGPEGGWDPDEVEAAGSAGFHKVHLGPRILRAETAGLALAAILQYERGDFTEF